MESKPWEQKEVPWCTVCLVLAIVSCHGLVLYGNMSTAASLTAIGTSTGGWAGVGLDLSTSLRAELDEIMKNVTEMITGAINQTLQTQNIIDLLVGLTGSTADQIAGDNTTKSLLQLQGQKAQRRNGSASPDISAMTGLVLGQIDQLLDQLMEKVNEALETLLVAIRPALEQVGAFISQFGEKVLAILDSFSNTLDKVQKIFDQVMTSMGPTGGSFEDVFHNTFTLFDFSNTGTIAPNDLKLAANTYKISALEGAKADELVQKYDKDGSGELDEKEFAAAAQDPSVPDMLPVVLRSFSSRLAEVSGLVGQSKFRDDVAQNVVSYLQLMGAKNMTKVYWISDRLTNASLPSAFTSDLMVNLAFQDDDPNAMTTADIGQVVIDAMLYMNANYTMKCFDQLSDTDYWESEGYDFDDQPTVIGKVTKWITNSPNSLLQTDMEASAGEDPDMILLEEEVLEAMPMVAKQLAQAKMEAHIERKMAAKHARYNELYKSKTAQMLRLHLLGGSHAADTAQPQTGAEKALATGVPAAPETLEFAQFLAWNSSNTASRFQGYCFDNTGTSSNAIDGFAQTIQGMVKKIKAFIEQMEKFSTPAGIDDIEEKVMNFASKGLEDVMKVIKTALGNLVNESSPMLDDAIDQAIHEAGETLGSMIGQILGTPLAKSLQPVIATLLAKLVGSENDSVSELAGELTGLINQAIEDVAGDTLGDAIGDKLEDVVTKALEDATAALEKAAPPSLMEADMRKRIGQFHLHHAKYSNRTADAQEVAAFMEKFEQAVGHAQKAMDLKVKSKKGELVDSRALRAEIKDLRKKIRIEKLPVTQRLASGCRTEGVCQRMKNQAALIATLESELEEEDLDLTSGVWGVMNQLLSSLQNILPLATENLKYARKEVSRLAKSLDSIFIKLDEKGSGIFDSIASIWRLVWVIYFCFVAPLTAFSLFYGFWAGGYFGGPGAPPVDEEEEKYEGFCGKLHACCCACCSCLRNYHDSQLCFWSFIIIMQIFTLVLFLVSLVFVVFAGIKIMIASGCSAVYMIDDETICGDTLLGLRQFLASFMGSTPDEAFGGMCVEDKLLACEMIGEKMEMSGIFTSAGSFVAALLTGQLLIESAILHTRAAERRRLAYLFHEKK
mmetsp:Transcript_127725/g.226319  ORF Transcript_127725/g.226319 Transcript_127725/m.226319 type:complete len:1124 (-) Transcript_127725:98-3469(-)